MNHIMTRREMFKNSVWYLSYNKLLKNITGIKKNRNHNLNNSITHIQVGMNV